MLTSKGFLARNIRTILYRDMCTKDGTIVQSHRKSTFSPLSANISNWAVYTAGFYIGFHQQILDLSKDKKMLDNAITPGYR